MFFVSTLKNVNALLGISSHFKRQLLFGCATKVRSANFERTFWCFQFFQKTNLKISISALAYKGRIFF